MKATAEELREYARLRYLAFPKICQATVRKWQINNAEKVKENHRRYCRLHSRKEERRQRHLRDRTIDLERMRRYYRKHKHKINPSKREYFKARRVCDHQFKLRQNLRGRLYDALKGRKKSAPTLTLLGCPIEDFWIYLESRFSEGMTRENYGKVWHVDHIIPCAIFDLTKPEHQKRCFHFSNMQPMFARDNLSKNDKIVTDQFQLL